MREQHDGPSSGLAGQFAVSGRAASIGRGPRGAAPVRVVEKSEPFFQLEHPPDAGVDGGHGHETALERPGQALCIGVAHHIDVDARGESKRSRLGGVAGDAVIEQFPHRAVVADDHAVEAEPVAQPALQQRGVGGHRDAGDVDERRHDGCSAGGHGGRKRRQVYFQERSLGDVDGGVFAAGGDGAIGAEMLCRRRQAVRRRKVAALEAARLGRRHF